MSHYRDAYDGPTQTVHVSVVRSLEESLRKAEAEVETAMAEVERLKVENELLRKATKRLPELNWKAVCYTELCDIMNEPCDTDITEKIAAIIKEWDELHTHTWQQERDKTVDWLRGRIAQHCVQSPETINILEPFQVVNILANAIERGKHWSTEGKTP